MIVALSQPLLEPGGVEPTKPSGLWKLYVSHSLSTFGDRLWQFAVPVLFMTIWNDTLLPGALFGFAVDLLTAFVLPSVGSWVDAVPRRRCMAIAIFGEASSMVCAAIAFGVMLTVLPEQVEGEDWKSPPLTPALGVCYGLVVVCSCITEIAMQAGTIALETDWPAVLVPKAQDEGGKLKAEVNSYMASIDQMSKITGPAAFGLVMQLTAGHCTKLVVASGVALVVAWNVLCVPMEWFALRALYDEHPALAVKESHKIRKSESFIGDFLDGWNVFRNHKLCLPCWSLVIVSFTVLNNQNPVSTAWLLWAGIPIGSLGLLRALGAVSGVIGSWSYQWVYRLAGSAEQTAHGGLWIFALALMPCAVAMAAFGGTTAGGWALLACMTWSRFAFFWFRPAMNQMVQEQVEDDVRGAFTGIRKSLSKVSLMGIGLATIIFSNPVQFPILVYISCFSVNVAAAMFSLWMWLTRRIDSSNELKVCSESSADAA